MRRDDRSLMLSVDIEANGPIPGDYSMYSFGAVAFIPEKWDYFQEPKANIISTFYGVCDELPGAMEDPDTMAWWKTQPVAFKIARTNPRPPEHVMEDFALWVEETRAGLPVTVIGYPVTFDFMFLYWYHWHFMREMPEWGFQGYDIKTQAAVVADLYYRAATKRRFPKQWFNGTERELAHHPVEDATAQAVLCMNIAEGRR